MMEAALFQPTWLGVADLNHDSVVVTGATGTTPGLGDSTRVLLRCDGIPLLWTQRFPNEIKPEDFSGLKVRAEPVTGTQVPVSVVLCTRDRPEQLSRCLTRLSEVIRPDTEVIVVDNAPSDSQTREAVGQAQRSMAGLMYVREDCPGLSVARNTGAAHTHGEILAFTDDDVIPDTFWLDGLSRGFQRAPDVEMVTGMVPPAELQHPAQARFDQLGERWTYNIEPVLYSMKSRSSYGFPFPWSGAHIGAGANMAIRRETLFRLGGFDEALGAGRRTGAGEDVEMFVRVIRSGALVAYEPSAIVWHFHRDSDSDLRKQLLEHAIGTGAFLTKMFIDPGRTQMILDASSLVAGHIRNRRASEEPDTEADIFQSSNTPKQGLTTGLALFGLVLGPVYYGIERTLLARERRRRSAATTRP
jgi:GT2 family glycosyltransferase